MHISKFEHHREDYAVPNQVTEEGIQKELGCCRTLVSSILKDYEKKGLVYRIKSKVDGKKYKQFAFFLTKRGRNHAMKIRRTTE